MAKCDCGADSFRIRGTQRKDGMSFICPSCKPDEFIDKDPPQDKLWHHQEAFPDLYKQGADGVLRPTDKLNQETQEWLTRNDNQKHRDELADKKRATRRTEPLKDWELRNSMKFGELLRARRLDQAIREGDDWTKEQLTRSN